MDTQRVDSLIRYALAVRSQGEFGANELGVIHLLKYVYLADLAHAEKTGETYTGAPWVFFHFGPWAQTVHSRIEAIVQGPGIQERRALSQKHENDLLRWRIDDADEVERELDGQLPTHAALAMRRAIKEHGDDTSGLLHYVYATEPMLRAKPHEALVFWENPEKFQRRPSQPPPEHVSAKQVKKRKKRIEELRAQARARLSVKSTAMKMKRPPAPRYDDEFWQGVAALDREVGEALPPNGVLRFDESMWDSEARYDSRDGDS